MAAESGRGVVIRAATTIDVERMLDLLEGVVDEGRWLAAEPPLDRADRRERTLALLEAEGTVNLLATVRDEVVGHLGMQVAPYGVAHFGMCVAATWRGRGVGTGLVTEAIEAARAGGAHKVSLEVWPHNGSARRLYRRHGFVEEGRLRRHYRRRNGELWDSIVMGLVLDEERPGSPHVDAD